jgi:hypothetical protein
MTTANDLKILNELVLDCERTINIDSKFTQYIYKIYHNTHVFTKFCKTSSCKLATCSCEWYVFENNIWNRYTGNTIIVDIISTIVEKYLENLANHFISNKDKLSESEYSNLIRCWYHIKSNFFCGNILKECKYLFFNSDFTKYLDMNPYLIATQNGVYDLQSCVFRQTMPSDNLHLQFKCDYVDNHKDYNVLNEYLSKLFPNNEHKEYSLIITSLCLTRIEDFHTFCYILSQCFTRFVGLSILLDMVCQLINENTTMAAYHRLALQEHNKPIYEKLNYLQAATRRIVLIIDNFFEDKNSIKSFIKKTNQVFESLKQENPSLNNKLKNTVHYKTDNDEVLNSISWKPAFLQILLEYWKVFIVKGLPELPKLPPKI